MRECRVELHSGRHKQDHPGGQWGPGRLWGRSNWELQLAESSLRALWLARAPSESGVCTHVNFGGRTMPVQIVSFLRFPGAHGIYGSTVWNRGISAL